MSRDSSGTYTAPANSWNPAVEGSTIDEGDWNTILGDIEDALTDSLDRTGKGKVTAHIDFDENGSPGTPASNVGRLYVGDNGGVTTLYFKDASGNVYDLTQAATAGLAYTFNATTTTNADPGTGKAAFNNATLASATEIAISTTTSGAADVASYIATWDDVGTTDRGRIIVQKRTDPSKIYVYRISGANTDATGYKRIAVTYVSGSGAISDVDPIAITWQPPGATGATGPSGSMSGPGVSVDGEIALYSGTGGATLKRASTTGVLKASSGVLAQAVAGTDYQAPLTAGTDYANLAFKTIAVSGQSDVVADSAGDTLTLAAGSNITITTNATTDTVTIAASGGGSGSPSIPQGRLTLTSATPVLTGTVSGATTVYYTPYIGQYVPIYNGTSWTMTDIGGELSQATTDSTKSPAACTTNSNYDLFVWSDSGTYRCTRGPAWSSDTARGTGAGTTELQMVSGIWTNKVAITNGPAANRGTYVGTIRTNGSSQVDFIYGTSAAGGGAGSFGVWNAYNRVTVESLTLDSNGTWSASSTIRSADNSTTYRCSFIMGLATDTVRSEFQCTSSVSSGSAAVGIGSDSTSTLSGTYTRNSTSLQQGNVGSYAAAYLGWHYHQALESANGGTSSFFGTQGAGVMQSGLLTTLRM